MLNLEYLASMKKLSIKIFVSSCFTLAPGGVRILVQQEKSAKLGRVGSGRSAGTRTGHRSRISVQEGAGTRGNTGERRGGRYGMGGGFTTEGTYSKQVSEKVEEAPPIAPCRPYILA